MNKGDQELGMLLGQLYQSVSRLIATWPDNASHWSEEQGVVFDVMEKLTVIHRGDIEPKVYPH